MKQIEAERKRLQEMKKLSEIRVELYQTSIMQEEKSLQKYWFEFVKNEKEIVFKSRKTIMDRPSWKNEQFTVRLDSIQDKFVINIFRSNRDSRDVLDSSSSYSGIGGKEKENVQSKDGATGNDEIFDRLLFPNPFKHKGLHPTRFIQRPDVRFKIRSQKHHDTTYFFNILWTQVGANQREADKLKLQKYGLEMKVNMHEKKRKELCEERQLLENSRLKPYEVAYTEIKDESLLKEAQERFRAMGSQERQIHAIEAQQTYKNHESTHKHITTNESPIQQVAETMIYNDEGEMNQNTLMTIDNAHTSPNVSIVSSPFDMSNKHSSFHQPLSKALHRGKTNSLVLNGTAVDQTLDHKRATPSFFYSPKGLIETPQNRAKCKIENLNEEHSDQMVDRYNQIQLAVKDGERESKLGSTVGYDVQKMGKQRVVVDKKMIQQQQFSLRNQPVIHDITDMFERTEQDGDVKEKMSSHLLDDPFNKQVSPPTYQSPANRSFTDVQPSFANDKVNSNRQMMVTPKIKEYKNANFGSESFDRERRNSRKIKGSVLSQAKGERSEDEPSSAELYKKLMQQEFSNSYCFKNRNSLQSQKQKSGKTQKSEIMESPVGDERTVGWMHSKPIAPFNGLHKDTSNTIHQQDGPNDLTEDQRAQIFGPFASPLIGKNLYQTDEKMRKENNQSSLVQSSLISSKDIYDKSIEIQQLTEQKDLAEPILTTRKPIKNYLLEATSSEGLGDQGRMFTTGKKSQGLSRLYQSFNNTNDKIGSYHRLRTGGQVERRQGKLISYPDSHTTFDDHEDDLMNKNQNFSKSRHIDYSNYSEKSGGVSQSNGSQSAQLQTPKNKQATSQGRQYTTMGQDFASQENQDIQFSDVRTINSIIQRSNLIMSIKRQKQGGTNKKDPNAIGTSIQSPRTIESQRGENKSDSTMLFKNSGLSNRSMGNMSASLQMMIRCVGVRNGMNRIGQNLITHHPAFKPSQVVEAEKETLEECFDKDDDSAGYTDLSQFHGNDDDEQQKQANAMNTDIGVRQHRPVRSDFGLAGKNIQPRIDTMSDPEQNAYTDKQFGDTPRYQESEYFNLFQNNRLEDNDIASINRSNLSPSVRHDKVNSDKVPKGQIGNQKKQVFSDGLKPNDGSNDSNKIGGSEFKPRVTHKININDLDKSIDDVDINSQCIQGNKDLTSNKESSTVQVLSENNDSRLKYGNTLAKQTGDANRQQGLKKRKDSKTPQDDQIQNQSKSLDQDDAVGIDALANQNNSNNQDGELSKQARDEPYQDERQQESSSILQPCNKINSFDIIRLSEARIPSMLNFGVMPGGNNKVRNSYPFSLNAFQGSQQSDKGGNQSVCSADSRIEIKDIDSADLLSPTSPFAKQGKKITTSFPASAKNQTHKNEQTGNQQRNQTKGNKQSLIDQLNRVDQKPLLNDSPEMPHDVSIGPDGLEINDQLDVHLQSKINQVTSLHQQRNRSSKPEKTQEKNNKIEEVVPQRIPRSHRHLNALVPSNADLTPLGHMRAQKYNLFMSTMLQTLDPNNSDLKYLKK